MADAEISILIEAQDKITAQLSEISNKISKFGEENKRASVKMGDAWKQSTNSLIAIGNAAGSVENIFSALTNMQLRLENASERLANAQDRVADAGRNVERAQRKVNDLTEEYIRVTTHGGETTNYGRKVIEEYTEAQENLADAHRDRERSERNLIISQNNLARAQNQVLGTLISVGVQSLSLVASVPTIIASIQALVIEVGILKAVIGIGAGVGVVGAVLALSGALSLLNQKELPDLSKELKDNTIPIVFTVRSEFDNWVNTVLGLYDAIEKLLSQEDDLKKFQQALGVGQFGGSVTVSGGGPPQDANLFLPGVQTVDDAIIRPDGSVIQTNPRDTLVAMKDINTSVGAMRAGNGIIVNINGNIYGVSAEQISRAMIHELKRKINI